MTTTTERHPMSDRLAHALVAQGFPTDLIEPFADMIAYGRQMEAARDLVISHARVWHTATGVDVIARATDRLQAALEALARLEEADPLRAAIAQNER